MSGKYSIAELNKIAAELRVDVIQMIAAAKSGHPGGSLSMIDILVTLFFHSLNYTPETVANGTADRFHLSKGHGCPAFYAVLARLGFFPAEELTKLRRLGALLQGHPHQTTPGIEVASGSLGQGLSVACGMALADRLNGKNTRVFTLLGDGELQEGQVWEAAMFAGHYKLDNLVVVVDNNNMQIDGPVSDVMSVYPLEQKWESFGFHVTTVDGHNIEQLIQAIEDVRQVSGKPQAIVAKTVKGKGVSFMEHNNDFHGKAPDNEQTEQALGELRN